jgi:hypothetical protein
LRLMSATRPIVFITPWKAARALVMDKPPVAVNRQGNHRSE